GEWVALQPGEVPLMEGPGTRRVSTLNGVRGGWLLERRDAWVELTGHGDLSFRGWVASSHFAPPPEAPPPGAVREAAAFGMMGMPVAPSHAATAPLRVRGLPKRDAPVVATLATGAALRAHRPAFAGFIAVVVYGLTKADEAGQQEMVLFVEEAEFESKTRTQ